tara:strand:- start:492 stop:1337 length:846 start_codon:yes stop_codon:yes gene_type:complete
MLEKNFTTIVFGATSLIGKSIIRSNPKKIVYISRKKIKKRNIKWFKFSINKKSKITKKRIKVGIFLISPRFVSKNFKRKIYEKEFFYLKKILDFYRFEKFIYLSSPTIYQKKHPIGYIKKKCEKFLIKNKKKFKNLQIWRPYNLVGEEKTNLSDHFHNFLFKKMFLQRKKGYLFSGCENDERGYSNVNNFTKLLLRKSNRNISFVKNYGNSKSIKINEIIKIYNYEYKKINQNYFHAQFRKKISNKNLINKKKNNCVLFREDNKIIFKRYLKRMIKLHKIN